VPVLVGRFGRAHGLRGEIVVEVRTDLPEIRFAPGAVLRCGSSAEDPGAGEREVTVQEAHVRGGRFIVRLLGMPDRSAVEPLTGLFLFAEAPLDETAGDEEEYFDRQLIGLRVVGVDGVELGRTVDVAHLPGQDLLVVQTGVEGGSDAAEVLVPFVGEIVVAVDLEAGRAVVDPPHGLFGPVPAD